MATHLSLSEFTGIPPANDFALAEAIEKGLPTENLELLRESGLTFTEMAAVIPHRTLKHRKARGENLTPEETERAVRIASTIALAEKVFGNPEKAMRWLRGKDDRLGDRTPLSMLKTEAGGKLIVSMLVGIAEGYFS
jgi:putative toxin-antitoxin system antitoxin component (TIGR02293 family)